MKDHNALKEAFLNCLVGNTAAPKIAQSLVQRSNETAALSDAPPRLHGESQRPAQVHRFGVGSFIYSQRIGRGAYGEVWLAENIHHGNLVALKKLKGTGDDRDGFPRTAIREVSLLTALRGHPHIVQFLGMYFSRPARPINVNEEFEPDNTSTRTKRPRSQSAVATGFDEAVSKLPRSEKEVENMIETLEHVEETLQPLIVSRKGTNLPENEYDEISQDGEVITEAAVEQVFKSPEMGNTGSLWMVFDYFPYDLNGIVENKNLNIAEVKLIIRETLDALAYCHQHNVIHRDIKAANIFLDANGHVKLGDFGLARYVHHDAVLHDNTYLEEPDASIAEAVYDRKGTMLSNNVVTFWYRPPELLLGAETYSTEVDTWSIGCVLVELLLGKPPFPASNELGVLKSIIENLGVPTEQTWPGHTNLPLWNSPKSNPLLANPSQQSRPFPTKSPVFDRSQLPHSAITSKVDAFRNSIVEIAGKSAWELLSGLLRYNPETRMTAAEALGHPWLNEGVASEVCMKRLASLQCHSFLLRLKKEQEQQQQQLIGPAQAHGHHHHHHAGAAYLMPHGEIKAGEAQHGGGGILQEYTRKPHVTAAGILPSTKLGRFHARAVRLVNVDEYRSLVRTAKAELQDATTAAQPPTISAGVSKESLLPKVERTEIETRKQGAPRDSHHVAETKKASASIPPQKRSPESGKSQKGSSQSRVDHHSKWSEAERDAAARGPGVSPHESSGDRHGPRRGGGGDWSSSGRRVHHHGSQTSTAREFDDRQQHSRDGSSPGPYRLGDGGAAGSRAESQCGSADGGRKRSFSYQQRHAPSQEKTRSSGGNGQGTLLPFAGSSVRNQDSTPTGGGTWYGGGGGSSTSRSRQQQQQQQQPQQGSRQAPLTLPLSTSSKGRQPLEGRQYAGGWPQQQHQPHRSDNVRRGGWDGGGGSSKDGGGSSSSRRNYRRTEESQAQTRVRQKEDEEEGELDETDEGTPPFDHSSGNAAARDRNRLDGKGVKLKTKSSESLRHGNFAHEQQQSTMKGDFISGGM